MKEIAAISLIIIWSLLICACADDDDNHDDASDESDDDLIDDDSADDNGDPNDDVDDDVSDDDINDDVDDDAWECVIGPSTPIINLTVEDTATLLVPDPPFPRSCGDLWPTAWCNDDHLYTANGDGFGFGYMWADMVVSRLIGDTTSEVIGESIPHAYGHFLGELWPPDPYLVSRKPTGMTCVDGVLYLFYQNLKNFLSDNEFGDAPAASISWSTDKGLTWQWDDSGPMFHDHIFTTGMFLDFGMDNACAVDDFVYVYGLDYNWRHSVGYQSTKLYLARMPKDRIPQRDAWEFFTGWAGTEVTWSERIEDKTPVIEDETLYGPWAAIGQGSVVFIPAISRYLYSSWGDTAWVFYEAPQPWGPWEKISVIPWYQGPYGEDFYGGYATVVPSKFLSEDGRSGWIISSLLGAFENVYYRLAMRRIFIETGE